MSADEFAARARGLHDAAHAGRAAEHAPHVHQLGRAVDRVPAERAAERVGAELGTCLLETGAEGTLDGASTRIRSGRSRAASIAHRTPSRPATLPSSCGSQQIVVVSCGTTACA